MKIRYTSSDGTVFDLRGSIPKLRSAAFHTYEWEAKTTERRFGERVDSWGRKPAEYTMEIYVYGPLAKRKDWLNRFHAAIEADLFKGTPGTLSWGSSYIYGFVRSSSTYPNEKNACTVNTIMIFCPEPFWIEEQTLKITAVDEREPTQLDKKYAYGYPYGYRTVTEDPYINIDHYAESDFRLIAYGPASSVAVTIGGNLYAVDHAVNAGEIMIIDTRGSQAPDRHAYIMAAGGRATNVFDYRRANSLLMRKIQPGMTEISYARTYDIDLTVYKRRSEPIWT